jgi:hypothetical protein
VIARRGRVLRTVAGTTAAGRATLEVGQELPHLASSCANPSREITMKITAIGLRRQQYRHEIIDRELKNARRFANKQSWSVNRDTGNVTFSWLKWSMSMHGDYQFSAELSREEIVRLFVSAMSDVPLKEVVRLLAESGTKPTTGTRRNNAPTSTVAAAA